MPSSARRTPTLCRCLTSVGSLWGLGAGAAVSFYGVSRLLTLHFNLVLNTYLVVFGFGASLLEVRHFFGLNGVPPRRRWCAALLFVASLCANDAALLGLAAAGAVCARALALLLLPPVRATTGESTTPPSLNADMSRARDETEVPLNRP